MSGNLRSLGAVDPFTFKMFLDLLPAWAAGLKIFLRVSLDLGRTVGALFDLIAHAFQSHGKFRAIDSGRVLLRTVKLPWLQYTLYSGVGFWPATLITSLLFFAGHAGNPGETAVGLFNVFVAGFALAIMLWRTGNLWFAVGFHAAWDWAQSFFYGVPDSGLVTKGHFFEGVSHGSAWLSGGATGPEGSLFSTLILILLIVLVLWRFKKSTYPDARWLPQQTGALI